MSSKLKRTINLGQVYGPTVSQDLRSFPIYLQRHHLEFIVLAFYLLESSALSLCGVELVLVGTLTVRSDLFQTSNHLSTQSSRCGHPDRNTPYPCPTEVRPQIARQKPTRRRVCVNNQPTIIWISFSYPMTSPLHNGQSHHLVLIVCVSVSPPMITSRHRTCVALSISLLDYPRRVRI